MWRFKSIRVLLPTALLTLAILALLAGRSLGREDRLGEYGVGETISAYWFDFSLDQVDCVDSYDGYHPREGYRLVVCRLSLENTFDEAVSMSQTDFFLLWPDGEESQSDDLGDMVGSYPLPHFSDRQLKDSYQLSKGERLQGDLVFEVPLEATRAALVFEEYYVDEESQTGYSVGDHYTVRFPLEEALPSP